MDKGKKRILGLAAVVVVAAGLFIGIRLVTGGQQVDQPPLPTETVPPTPTPLPEETQAPPPTPTPTPIPDVVDGLPVEKLVVTPERSAYTAQQLTLTIPVLNITYAIHNGTDSETLKKGVGLYEYAQLPGEGNRNVSLAGHRNGLRNGKITDSAPFYYIDTVKEGDYLYLYDSEWVYRYQYDSTWVVEPDDWGPIKTTGYSCITITSCTPIGISDHRIVVRGVLDEIFTYSKDFEFVASALDSSTESEV